MGATKAKINLFFFFFLLYHSGNTAVAKLLWTEIPGLCLSKAVPQEISCGDMDNNLLFFIALKPIICK